MCLDKQYETKKDGGKIFIFDVEPIVRLGLAQLIRQETNFLVCGEAENVHEALKAIEILEPDMAIIGISLKDSMQIIEKMKGEYPRLPILVFSIFDEAIYAERLLQIGAKGYLTKHEPLQKIIEAVHKVLFNEIFVSDKIAEKIIQKALSGPSVGPLSLIELLSNRQLEVFQLTGQGHGTRQIAEQMCLSIKTIEAYKAQIKNKLKITSAAKLTQQAVQWIQMETESIGKSPI